MRFPLSWLQSFGVRGLHEPESEWREILDCAGLEVASIHKLGEAWNHIAVGRIDAVSPIPDTHLWACTVAVSDSLSISVVSGAPNLDASAVGRRVGCALPGARLAMFDKSGAKQDVTVESRSMRGHRSEGVLVSEAEIGLSDDHSGLMWIQKECAVGTPLNEVLGEVVLEIELTPDLGRCLSVFGMAREICALFGHPVAESALELAPLGEAGPSPVPVRIADPTACNRYIGLVVEGLSVGPSPGWLQQRLVHSGLRPINNLVDISNYVMLEMGQPLHFFDLDKLAGPEIEVRFARAGEAISALNGQSYALDSKVLVIADRSGPVAAAGVIGSRPSAIDATTRRVLIEAAHFDSLVTRKSSQSLKLRTDAAERFIKGVDPEWTWTALRRAVALVLAGNPDARIIGYQDEYPQRPQPAVIPISPRDVERIVGISLSSAQIAEMLGRFGFSVAPGPSGDSLLATAPTYRTDVEHVQDLIEEITRAVGLNRIAPDPIGAVYLNTRSQPTATLQAQRTSSQILRGAGFSEAMGYSFCSAQDLEFGAHWRENSGQFVEMYNPLSADKSHLRISLIPGLLRAVSHNLRFGDRAQLFEMGRAYFQTSPGSDEHELAAFVCTGDRRLPFWGDSDPGTAFGARLGLYDLKGLVASWLAALGSTHLSFSAVSAAPFLPGQAFVVASPGGRVGFLAELAPEFLRAFDIDQRVWVAELSLDALGVAPAGALKFSPPWDQPAVQRDLSVLVPTRHSVAALLDALGDAAGEQVRGVELFDRYQGQGIADAHHALAFRLTFQHRDRTLTSAEVDAALGLAIARLREEFGAVQR